MSTYAETADVSLTADEPKRTEATETNRFAAKALEDHKREGLLLAVRARWAALAIIAVMLPFLNPTVEVLYYEFLLALFALIGWGQLKVWQVGQSRAELFLMFCDLALMTFAITVPNPFSAVDWSATVQYRFGTFIYFFVFLAGATLSYSWRTVVAMGTWTSGLWAVGVGWVYFQPLEQTELSNKIKEAVGDDHRLFELLDPHNIMFDQRVQEIVLFLIIAYTLALGVRRANDLVSRQAAAERERTNLARYFSPNVVAELSQNDEPLKRVRTQDIAVLFVDIVGFSSFAEDKSPEQTIATLREFHGRMETEVFKHHGTLDKYLGDGLMATFGTPFTSDTDASNALACAKAMVDVVENWNKERERAGEEPITASFGIHYGPATLGDIGANRLEFAVLGNTVNVASRLENLTRKLGCTLLVSDDAFQRASKETAVAQSNMGAFKKQSSQKIRGLEKPITVWAYGNAR